MDDQKTYNVCMGVGCHAGCIHTTRVRDGKIAKIEPTNLPDGEKGVICVKGPAGARLPYHPERLKYPLKRAGKRGEGKWERIAWEQALDEIAEKINNIRETYQPESVFIRPFYNSVSYSSTQMLLSLRFVNLLEATSGLYGNSTDGNPNLSSFFTYGMGMGHFVCPEILTEGQTKYMIVWGCDPKIKSNRFWRSIREAQKNGAKLVDIGLLNDATAKAADWYIPVNPGSDGALALSMIHVIICKNLFDKDYIKKHTNGPFLVRSDNGKLLRESDISAQGSPENYVAWDMKKGELCVIAPHADDSKGCDFALTGHYDIGGVQCKPAFLVLSDLVEQHGPEAVSGITGVRGDTIERLAEEYATTKPAAILLTFGLRYSNSGNAIRAMDILAAITGNIGEPGGGTIIGACTTGLGNSPMIRLNDDPIAFATDKRSKNTPLAQIFECMTTGKPYPIKAFISYGWNYLNTYPNPRRWIEDVFPNLDLIVVNEIFMTATAEYADYVLPDCTHFERDDMDIVQNGYMIWQDKAVAPMHDCRPPIFFWSELAKRLNLGEYFDKTVEEWSALRLNAEDSSISGIDPPLTLERLKSEKMVKANVPPGVFNPWSAKKFLTPSGRIEFYNEELLTSEDALPVFRESMESPRSKLAEKYPLVFNTANPKYFVHTMFSNDPEMLKKYFKEPHVSINWEDAKRRNISDGDVVTLYNDRGSCKAKALISDMVPPGVVNLPYGWWPGQFIEGHPQNLVASIASLHKRNKVFELLYEVAGSREMPVGAIDPNQGFSYSADTLYDCLCEVKRG